MPRRAEPTAVRIAPFGGATDGDRLRRWAERLGATSTGTAALVEWRSGDPPALCLAVPDRATWRAIEPRGSPPGDPEVRPGPLEPPPLVPPVRLWRLERAVLEEPTGLAGEDPAPAPVVRDIRTAPATRWVVQLHLWSRGVPGRLAASVRFAVGGAPEDVAQVGAELGVALSGALRPMLGPVGLREHRSGRRALRDFRTGRLRRARACELWDLPTAGPPALHASLAAVAGLDPRRTGGHRVLFGSTGAGKTALLARWASEAIRSGDAVVALDIHGDLAPAIVAGLPTGDRARVIALDGGEGRVGSPGIDLLAGGSVEEVAPRLVAAVRRGSEEDGTRYWGFRLERLFDEFVRLALAEGGTLRDLYALLTDERRREAARLATKDPDRAAFLQELQGIVRRNPEFLWPAAARISKLLFSAHLARLVAPVRASIDPGPWIAKGRPLLVRVPMGSLGPEAAHAAATLLLARIYLDRIATGDPGTRLFLVVDEAQAVAPSLLAEILTEGRKFGVDLWLATQFPGRLDPGLREAAAASARLHLALRTPAPAAGAVGSWLGLAPGSAEATLPALAPGAALAVVSDRTGPLRLPPDGPPPSGGDAEWAECRERTFAEFGDPDAEEDSEIALADRLFEVRRRELTPPHPPLPGTRVDPLVRRGWVRDATGVLRTTAAGRVLLGEEVASGATRESATHRALLSATFRILARHGLRLEIVRQGRFDTRLPDGRFRWLSREEREGPPEELRRRLEARHAEWGYRAFGGRDLFVEAEVSGARRRERLRRDLAKANAAGAHCLLVVADPDDGRSVRRHLRAMAVPAGTATVWVLRPRYWGREPAPDAPAGAIDPAG